ncbi:MAG: carbohydrate-binding domain-containing protein [Ancrocorticia sp.]
MNISRFYKLPATSRTRRIHAAVLGMLGAGALILSGCSAGATGGAADATTSSATGTSTSASESASTATTGEVTAAVAITSTDQLADATHYDSDDAVYQESEVTTVTLSGTSAKASGPDSADVTVSEANGEAVVTISGTGTYRLSGTLAGQVVVTSDSEAALQLILDGAKITSATGPAINITAADEVTVILAKGSQNTLTDAATRPTDTADLNTDTSAALHSKADLTITGTGALTVTGTYDDAIHTKDGLVIDGPNVTVTAVDDGIIGKDYLVLVSGSVDVTSTDTGFGSDNNEEENRGWLSVLGGSLTVSTDDDGVKAENAITIAGGTLDVTESGEGIEAARILIAAGTVTVTSNDDGINASGGYGTTSTEDTAGTEGAAAGDTAADGASSGEVPLTGEMPAGHGQMPGGGMGGMEAAGDQTITITGGTVTVNAGGDGLDSNGSMEISGGTVTVNGPENDGNAALDAAGTFEITGGTLLATGSSGMAQAPETSSSQTSISTALSANVAAGTPLAIADSSGTIVTTFTASKSIAHVVFSSDKLTAGQEYTVYQLTSDGQTDLSAATALVTATAGEYDAMGMGGMGTGGRP